MSVVQFFENKNKNKNKNKAFNIEKKKP